MTSTSSTRVSVCKSSSSTTPFPNIITQVSKDDEKKFQLLELLNINKCCSFFFRCFGPAKSRKESFNQIQDTMNPSLLDPQLPEHKGRKVLVLDLDETLVHSTFDPVKTADLVLPVKLQGQTYKINVMIRPGTEEFLTRMGELYEVVIFTASLAEYAEPLVRELDKTNVVASLLYRQHCTPFNGVYVKNLSLLGRDMKDIILVDNSPNSFIYQPENAYHIKNFFDDKTDTELDKLTAFLENIVNIDDVRPIADLRKIYEPKVDHNKITAIVKVAHDPQDPEELEDEEDDDPVALDEIAIQPDQNPAEVSMKDIQTDKDEKAYNVETEPDLRKDDREEEYQSNRSVASYRFNKFKSLLGKSGPLTERIGSDRPKPELDSSEIIENIVLLPSPKESDALINHREADAFFGNNSDDADTTVKEVRMSRSKPKIPPFAKSNSAIYGSMTIEASEIVTVDEPTLEGHKVDEIRFLTGIDNLNSPLGRHVKIEFNNNMNKQHKVGSGVSVHN